MHPAPTSTPPPDAAPAPNGRRIARWSIELRLNEPLDRAAHPPLERRALPADRPRCMTRCGTRFDATAAEARVPEPGSKRPTSTD